MTDEFPQALAHGEIEQVFPDVFFVMGSMQMKSGLTFTLSRNMTIVRQGSSLTLINSVRLGENGLKELEQLGKVENVIRIGGFHGRDDAFYKSHYGAKVWNIKGQFYTSGFELEDPQTPGAFKADEEIDPTTSLPIDANVFFFSCKPAEALLLLNREGGIVVAADALQNWAKADRFFGLGTKIMMGMMGFIKPHNVGPGWLKFANPNKQEIKNILNLNFEHVLPAHGTPVIGSAKEKYRPMIDKVCS